MPEANKGSQQQFKSMFLLFLSPFLPKFHQPAPYCVHKINGDFFYILYIHLQYYVLLINKVKRVLLIINY